MENDEFNTMKHTLLFVAIIISGTIIAAVVFDSFPLIPVDLDEERIKTINAFAVDASLGVLTSIIFYYLLVYMGERKRAKDMRKLIQGKLNFTAMLMQAVIAFYVDKCQLSVKDNRLYGFDKSDFEKPGGIQSCKIDYWYHCPPGSGCTFLRGSTEVGFLRAYIEKVVLVSEQILDSPGFAIEETKLITLITNIKNCNFVREVNLIYANKDKPIGRAPVGGKLYEFYQLYLQLLDFAKVDEIEIRGDVPAGTIAIEYM